MDLWQLLISALYSIVSIYYFIGKLQTGVVVNIKNGPLIGDIRTTVGENLTYYSFQGIPYAKPPVGDLRFSEPVPPDDWIAPRLAIQAGEECLQSANSGSEDCLYINVFTPRLNSTEKLPVMIWVYGGYFLEGNGNSERFGPDYLLEKDVVIVTFNYRLGVFGFLSTEDESALGNWGIKDQLLALQWVQENIHAFGGDKNLVTIFGQSAGAGGVSYLSQISQAEGLYHRVILQSGSSLNLWALARQARNISFTIGNSLGLNASDSETLIKELREVEATILHIESSKTDLFSTFMDNPRNGLVFAPVIEPKCKKSVITWRSHEKLSKGDFYRVPFMLGFNTQEAGESVNILDWVRLFLVTFDLNPSKMIPVDMNLNPSDTSTVSLVAKAIKEHYFGTTPAAINDSQVIQFVSDDQFVRPMYETARLLGNYTSAYVYRFSYVGEQDEATRGVDSVTYHSDELQWIWNFADRSKNLSRTDERMKHQMLTLWTNFAKYGNPTPNVDPTLDSAVWEEVNSSDVYYFDIGKELRMDNDWSNYSISFWQNMFNDYGNPPYDTY